MSGTGARLRVGLLVRGSTLRRWQADAVGELLAVPGVELALVVRDARPAPPRAPRERLARIVRSRTALWDLYNNGWVARRSRCLAPVDCSALLAEAPAIDVEVDRRGYSEYVPSDAIEEIRSHELDVLVRFAFGILRGEILEAARYGVWSFHHDDEDVYRGSPPAFWELVEDDPVTGALLQRLTDRLDGGRVLHKGWFRTVRHSYLRNTDTVHLGSTDWVARTARAVLAGDAEAGEGHPSTSEAPLYRKPGNARTARFLATQTGRFLRSQAEGVLRSPQWEVGVVHHPVHRWLDEGFRPRVEWLGLADPRLGYAADPFLVPGPTPTVLYEHYLHGERRGEIWEAPLDGSSPPRPATLSLPAHASYPFTFQHRDRVLCIPQVEGEPPRLHRFEGHRWVTGPALLPHPVLDPTVVEHEGRWWLFGTLPGELSLAKLHLWWAPDPEGPWQPHPLNPVKTDVRSARPAGTPFTHGGRLFRPAQDCSTGYGSAVGLCRIRRLDPRGFEEDVVRVLRPDPTWPFPAGMHTLSDGGGLTLLDAHRETFNRHRSAAELRARLGRLRR